MQSLCTLRNHCRQWPATLATKRTLLLTWAGLAPAGSHQLCLAHLLDHLVGDGENARRNRKTECIRSLEIDNQFELGGLLNWKIGGLGSPQYLVDVICSAPPHLDLVRTV